MRLLFFMLLLSSVAAGQSVGYLRYDTVKVMKQGGVSVLKIEGAFQPSSTLSLATTGNMPAIGQSFQLDTISSDQTVTFTALENGRVGTVMFVENVNSSAFVWNVSGPVIEGSTGETITVLTRGSHIFRWNGSYWNHTGGSGGSTPETDSVKAVYPLYFSGPREMSLDPAGLPEDTSFVALHGTTLWNVLYRYDGVRDSSVIGDIGGGGLTAANGIRIDGGVIKLANEIDGGTLDDNFYLDGHTNLKNIFLSGQDITFDPKGTTLFQANTVDSAIVEMKQMFKTYLDSVGDFDVTLGKNYAGAVFGDMTTDRTVTMHNLSMDKRGTTFRVLNLNTTANSRLVSQDQAAVVDEDGSLVTSITDKITDFLWDGSKWVKKSGGGGGGISYIFSSTAPTGADTGKLWIQTPLNGKPWYDVYIRFDSDWRRYGWYSIDGVLTSKRPVILFGSGQSNSQGYTPGTDKGEADTTMPGVLVYYNKINSWGTADPLSMVFPFHESTPSNNTVFSLAKQIKREGVADIVAFAIAAQGGITINNWIGNYPSGGTTYMMDSVRNIMSRWGLDSIDAFIWQQGETYTTRTPDVNGGYFNDLEVLRDSLLSPLTPDFIRNYTKFISTTQASNPAPDTSTTSSAGLVRGSILRLNEDYDIHTAATDGFGIDVNDGAHWTGPGVDSLARRLLGTFKGMPRRYAEEVPKWSYSSLQTTYALGRNTAFNNTGNGMTTEIQNQVVTILGGGNSNQIVYIDGVNRRVIIGTNTSGFTGTLKKFNVFNGLSVQGQGIFYQRVAASQGDMFRVALSSTYNTFRIDSLGRKFWGGNPVNGTLGVFNEWEGTTADTTTATETDTQNLYTVPSNNSGVIEVTFIGKKSDNSDVYTVTRRQRFTNASGTLTLLGTLQDVGPAEVGLTGVAVALTTSGTTIQGTQTGIAATTIYWRMKWRVIHY